MSLASNQNISFSKHIIKTAVLLTIVYVILSISYYEYKKKEIIYRTHEISSKFLQNLSRIYIHATLNNSEYALQNTTLTLSKKNKVKELMSGESKSTEDLILNILSIMPNVTSISISDSSGNYMRIPKITLDENTIKFDPNKRPWFIRQSEKKSNVHYTDLYEDYFSHQQTITMYEAIVSRTGELQGTLAFHLDLIRMSQKLRELNPPVKGEFYIINRKGDILLHQDYSKLKNHSISNNFIKSQLNSEGRFFNENAHRWYYYHSLVNPNWIAVYEVKDSDFHQQIMHELSISLWFILLVISIFFGAFIYLYLTSRAVLINIINAVTTGTLRKTPKLESMLSNAIIKNKKKERNYERQATIDVLTKCKNRRSFDGEIKRLMINNESFSIALLDIDNFKNINDGWGHLTGDIVLRNVSRLGIELLRQNDLSLYRYGGEEFAIIFKGMAIDKSFEVLEIFRVSVQDKTWREEGLTVTFSAGLAEWDGETPEQLILKIDELLYKAKENGKNLIVI